MPATKKKPATIKPSKCTCPELCLCNNFAAVELLASAIESTAEEVARLAHHEDWDAAIEYGTDLIGILKAIKRFDEMYPRKKGGKRCNANYL